MEAVQQLSAHFQGYASIPKVSELSHRLQALQTSLRVSALSPEPLNPNPIPKVSELSHRVQALQTSLRVSALNPNPKP